jgi:hypothetical protein
MLGQARSGRNRPGRTARRQDPAFTLRFQYGSTVQRTLTPTDDRQFKLTKYTGPASPQVD